MNRPALHNTVCVCCIMLASLLHTYGQATTVMVGQVSDLSSGRPISGAEIRVKGTGHMAHSNSDGWYRLTIQGTGNALDSFGFVGHVLVWDSLEMMELQIWSLKGQLVYEGNLTGGPGLWCLPNMHSGVYLLVISYGGQHYPLMAASLGNELMIVQPSAPFIRAQTDLTDTIEVRAQGYNTRYLARTRATGTQHVKLLPQGAKYLDYLPELFDTTDYGLLAGAPSRSLLGQVASIKVVYDFDRGLMYYINANKYQLHYDFCKEVLGYDQGIYRFNLTQYPRSAERMYYLGDLNYYRDLDRFVFQFVASNEFGCGEIADFFAAIKATSFFANRLVFYSIKQEWDNCAQIGYIDTETLYGGQNYLGLNTGFAYGYLRVVQPFELPSTYLSKRDIVVYNGLPNDMPVVAGLVTTEFQTPLSHINILSHSRGTPNMTLRNALENPQVMGKLGQLVYLEVTNNDYVLRKANLAEAEVFWASKEPKGTAVPAFDLSVSGLVDLNKANYRHVGTIGSKAANFAEMMKVRMDHGTVPLPEMAFAIPFYYYQQHLVRHGIDKAINQALQSQAFRQKPSFRQKRLAQLRDTIIATELDPGLRQAVMDKMGNYLVFKRFRFRSSTNAEDLNGFSGAGLYSSATAQAHDADQTADWAIKSVWAGLWNWRAFEERSYYGIDHGQCMMGVLVHRAFPSEDANGVLITTNLYNANDGIIINAQYSDLSIVRPSPGLIHEQIMVYRYAVDPLSKYTIEYLSFSNAPGLKWETVLTKGEVTELMDYALAIKAHFYYNVLPQCTCSLEDFALDIEFKVDSEVKNRKVYVKQVRPYGQY